MSFKMHYYRLICLVLEKYGYNIIQSTDLLTLYVCGYGDAMEKVSESELRLIFRVEEFDCLIDNISISNHLGWKIQLISV